MSSSLAAAIASQKLALKHKRARNYGHYARFIYAVLKELHPGTGISAKAMAILESLVQDMFERLATEAGRLARYNKHATMTARDVQSACRFIFRGELGKHAVLEGTKAVMKYREARV